MTKFSWMSVEMSLAWEVCLITFSKSVPTRLAKHLRLLVCEFAVAPFGLCMPLYNLSDHRMFALL